jgi:hypothetical protein
VRADDGRGGVTEQFYVVTVSEPPPNRPPFFTSLPVVEAHVNEPYLYVATALDPDGDVLRFAFTTAPAGLQIDPDSGAVTWTPAANQAGDQSVTLTVSDERGGTATQTYAINVRAETGNHAPSIISDPVTTFTPAPPIRFFFDFDGGAPVVFTGVTTTESVQGYAGVGTGENVFAGRFLRNTTGGPHGQAGVPTSHPVRSTGTHPHRPQLPGCGDRLQDGARGFPPATSST